MAAMTALAERYQRLEISSERMLGCRKRNDRANLNGFNDVETAPIVKQTHSPGRSRPLQNHLARTPGPHHLKALLEILPGKAVRDHRRDGEVEGDRRGIREHDRIGGDATRCTPSSDKSPTQGLLAVVDPLM